MAPLCKVLLIDDSEFEEGENIHSGPHSMLFGVKDGSVTKDLERFDVNATFVNPGTEEANIVPNVPNTLIRSDTYESLPIAEKTHSNKTLVKSDTYDKPDEDYPPSNSTFRICPTENCRKTTSVENLAYLNENNFPDIVNSTRIISKFDKSNNCSNSSSEDGNKTVVLNNSITVVPNKERNIPNSLTCVPCTSTDLSSTAIYSGIKTKKSSYYLEVDRKGSFLPQRTKANFKNEPQIIDSNKNFNETFVSETKVKCLKLHGLESVNISQNVGPVMHSTPIHAESDIENSPRRRRIRGTPAFSPANEDDGTKRDSLEFEESLGILTPEQMADLPGFPGSRTPSSENIGSLPNDFQNFLSKFQCDTNPQELPSPNLVDASVKELSLGIIDENMLLSFAIKSDTTTNMELPLDSIGKSKSYTITRLDQTPSPEDLPLDPTPVIECESKTEPTKSKTASSFITSITSITSLDTGYQGDGEMSRPASRGADHSPLTRRPVQRPQPRRPDPLTDSDFYTESDADNHEEHPLRGDRLARVIDGTLYGVDPQAAADIYVNNRENMDSSGIFTDIEGNTRTDELSSAENENADVSPSPSDTSSKTISNDSQNNAPAALNKTVIKTGSNSKHNSLDSCDKNEKNNDLQMKRKSPTPSSVASSPASVRSPRHTPRDDNASKKYKMPKRNVASKVKAVLESNTLQRKETINVTPKKAVGRWDAVMNKITKNPSSFKEIKSKVFTNHNTPPPVRPNVTPSNKQRRTRTRSDTAITKMESLHSSASDLSAASPAKRIGSGKKRAEVVRVTQVLTAAKLSPRSVHKNTLTENKKNVAKPPNDVKSPPRKILFSPKDKKQISTASTKDGARATVKGGRVSPGARPPQQIRVPTAPISRTTEALAVLVQHLVFNLEAFQTPSLKKQIDKSRIIAEEARLSCRQMEEHIKQIEEERAQYRKNVEDIAEQHRKDILQLNRQHLETEQQLISEHESIQRQLSTCHSEQLLKLRVECNKLQQSHEQSLDILREENDSIREEIDEKNALIAKLETIKKENEKSLKEFQVKEKQYKDQIHLAHEEITSLKAENFKLLNLVSEGKENKLQIVLAEVESLRAVLELKQTEIADLRKLLAQANQKADLVPSIAEKVSLLSARCEDLESQLESKSLFEQQLVNENRKIHESLKEELNQSIRLRQHNEELQWKLQQNKEVVSRVIEETTFSRSLLNSSYNEHHNSNNKQLERALSFRERSLSNKSFTSDSSCRSRKSKNSYDLDPDDLSPPSSPKVKGVVEKSDSVSYVLEMEESPEMIANRIVRRSFRNSTPPKTTPTKSPANKRPRMKNNPLSLSASASAIIPNINNRSDISRSRSVSVRNEDIDTGTSHSDEVFMWQITASSTPHSKHCIEENCKNSFSNESNVKYEHNIDLVDFNEEDINLPALPSELGRKNVVQSLPVPKHLAGEAMVSESNSEDESTASTSSGQL